MKNWVIIAVLLLIFANNADGKINVYTSILPQKFFVEKIGGDRVTVDVLVIPGKSPAIYEPAPKQVLNLSNADVFFRIGVPFEIAFIPNLRSNIKNLKNVLLPYRDESFFVFHPAFRYFADEFSLKQITVETGGKEPPSNTLEKMIQNALDNNIRIIFVQPVFSKKSAEAVASAINGNVVILNPLDPDYINNLKHIANEIRIVVNKE